MSWCSVLSAYSHFGEVILWENVPTKQYRSERGGLPCCWFAIFISFCLSVPSVFHHLCLCCIDDLGCFAFMLVYRDLLEEFCYQVCSLGSLQTTVCSGCICLQWDFSFEKCKTDRISLFLPSLPRPTPRYWILIFPLPLVSGGFLQQACACKLYPSKTHCGLDVLSSRN